MSKKGAAKRYAQFMESKEGQKLSEAVANSLFRSAVADGELDPRGKTGDDIHRAFFNWWKSKGARRPLRFVIDHTPTLLGEARAFVRRGKSDFACLMYATWAEHWINAIIKHFGKKRGIREKDLLEVIRRSPMDQKLSWVWMLVEAPPLAKVHLQRIKRLIDSRNQFVHYKWIEFDPDQKRDDEETPLQELRDIEKLIKYLSAYERRNVYMGRIRLPRRIGTKEMERLSGEQPD